MSQAQVIANCPNPQCNKAILIDHTYSWCTECGESLPNDIQAKIPSLQKIVADAARTRQNIAIESAPLDSRNWSMAIQLGVAGLFVGLFIGYLLRPAAPLIGQLDFETVISRGSNLKGFDQLLVSTAEASSNYMIVGGIIVGLIGTGIGYAISSKKEVSAAPPQVHRQANSFLPNRRRHPHQQLSPLLVNPFHPRVSD